MENRPYTLEEISGAYQKMIYVQGIVDYVLNAGFDIDEDRKAEIEDSFQSIFSIIQDYLLDRLDNRLDLGYEQLFAGLWKKREQAQMGKS